MTPALRPLSFSEMLDRAFVLSLRTLLPMAAVVALMVGLAFGGAWTIVYLGVVVAHAPSLVPAIFAGLYVFAVIVAGHAAALTGLIDAYFGRPVQLSRMLTGARRTWPQLSLLFVIYLAICGLLGGVVIALFYAGVWFGNQLPFVRSWPGAIVGIGFVILFICIVIALYGFVLTLGYIAFVGCVAEWSPALEAWERGWKRSAAEGRAWRTAGFGVLILFGGLAVTLAFQLMGLGIAALLPKGTLLSGLVAGAPVVLSNLFYIVFQWAFFVVYYVDLRIRTEGLDLVIQSDSLKPAVAGAPAEA
jgi:hypothetical protein